MKSLDSNELSILIISYDGAKELWTPFSQAWKQQWPECPFEVILITQEISTFADSCFDRVIAVPSKPTQAIYRIEEALKHVTSKYVLVMCDDYLIYDKPQKNIILNIIEIMRDRNISCVHLDNRRKTSKELKFDDLRNSNFIVSGGVPSIYEKNFMYMLCKKFEDCTMREWELNASRWLQKEKYIIKSISNSSFKCYHCVLEGYWRLKPYLWTKKYNFQMRFYTYKKPSFGHSIWAVAKAICFNIVLKIFPQIYNKWSQKKYE